MADTWAEPRVRLVSIAGHPIYSMLLPVPVVCFLGALITDLAYVGSDGNLLWLNFSSWVLTAGLLFGGIAIVVLLIDVGRSAGLRSGAGWGQLAVTIAAWIVGLINSFVHARDGWTAVVPAGLVLSIIGAILMLAAGWLHRPAMEPVR